MTAVLELLRDYFTRLIEHVEDVSDDLTDEVSFFRPNATAKASRGGSCFIAVDAKSSRSRCRERTVM